MDKQQKELTTTYFRKRSIAAAGEDYHSLSPYEMEYLKSVGVKFIEYLGPRMIANIISYYPEKVNEFNLSQFTGQDIFFILKKQPGLFDKLDVEKIVTDNVPLKATEYASPELAEKLVTLDLSANQLFALLDKHRSLILKTPIRLLDKLSDEQLKKLNLGTMRDAELTNKMLEYYPRLGQFIKYVDPNIFMKRMY